MKPKQHAQDRTAESGNNYLCIQHCDILFVIKMFA